MSAAADSKSSKASAEAYGEAVDAKSLFTVSGKNVLVTGGARGIGRMIAEAFVRAGNRVYLSSRDAKANAEAAEALTAIGPGTASAHAFDLSSVAGCRALAQAMPERLHVLVNNSGYAWGEALGAFSEKGWDRVMDVNLKGLFFLTQALLPRLIRAATPSDPARVVNVGSVAGLLPQPFPTYSYDLSKKGVHYLTQKLAGELANATSPVTVNAIAPGLFATKMGSQLGKEEALVKHIPLGRAGKPADMAGIALFLASPAAAWITGAIIPVDGGQTAWRGVRAKL